MNKKQKQQKNLDICLPWSFAALNIQFFNYSCTVSAGVYKWQYDTS